MFVCVSGGMYTPTNPSETKNKANTYLSRAGHKKLRAYKWTDIWKYRNTDPPMFSRTLSHSDPLPKNGLNLLLPKCMVSFITALTHQHAA